MHRVHALLRTTVPILSCPLAKAHMRELEFEKVLCDVLHRSVGAWTGVDIKDREHCVALQAVCQVVVDALKVMCDVKVRPVPHLPSASFCSSPPYGIVPFRRGRVCPTPPC